MIVGLAGASGLLGAALARRLRAQGLTVLPIPRALGRLPGVDAVVNLRPAMTRVIVDRMLDLPRRPAVFVNVGREEEARVVEAVGIRVVLPRFGRILRADDAVDGRPWIGLDDAVRLILFALERGDVRGPLDGTAFRPPRGFQLRWEAI